MTDLAVLRLVVDQVDELTAAGQRAETIIHALCAHHGGATRRRGDVYEVKLLSVTSGSTGGWPMALSNWQAAARRRLEDARS